MYEQTLQQSGLDQDLAIVYEALLKNGPNKAGSLTLKTPLKRGLVYKLLDQLVELGLAEKDKPEGAPAIFKPAHPLKLKELAEKREKQAKDAQMILDGAMQAMVSDFNMVSHKPNVRFYEGKEGLIKIYEELLDENALMDSIEDKGEMAEFLPDYFPKFIQKRIKRGIYNRVVCPASNPINKTNEAELRETRNISAKEYPLSMDIKIVNNKVSLMTLRKKTAIGILIDHPEIAENFKIIFKYMWDSLDKSQNLKP